MEEGSDETFLEVAEKAEKAGELEEEGGGPK